MAKKQQANKVVAYLRKSTKGTNADGSQRQEKSISQQRRELEQLAKKENLEIVRWFEDAGVSGWKRGAQRPDFDALLSFARESDFRGVLCDDLDRFSRAEVMEVFADLSSLGAAGVEFIHTSAQGRYGLGDKDIGKIIKLVVDVHGSNDYSRKLSRRIALARRNAAKEGRRSGGIAPYGLKNKDGGLVRGATKEFKVVQDIFSWFVKEKLSLGGIAKRLNEKRIKSPGGAKWTVETIRRILKNEAYRGTFAFNKAKSGKFFVIDESGEVVESEAPSRVPTEDGVFRKRGAYEAFVSPKTFEAAQRRMASFKSAYGTRRTPRSDSPALSGTLYCGHCGKPLYGTQSGKRVVYRCASNGKSKDACGFFEVREDLILPYVVKALGEQMDELELESIATVNSGGGIVSAKVPRSSNQRDEARERLEEEIAQLEQEIAVGVENSFAATNEAIRDRMLALLASKQERQKQAKEELSKLQSVQPKTQDDTAIERELIEWWEARRPLFIPNSRSEFCEGAGGDFYRAADVREVLGQLGARIVLFWKREEVIAKSSGKKRIRNFLEGGVMQLGCFEGVLASSSILCHARRVGRCGASVFCRAGGCSIARRRIPNHPRR